MNERQYNIVKIFTEIKLPNQLEKIAKIFKLDIELVYKVAQSYNFQQFSDPNNTNFFESIFNGKQKLW